MGTDRTFPAAGEAIRLRLLVRAALDRDDMPAVCRLNRIADEAYANLDSADARVYLEWCRDDMQSFLFGMGDA